MPQNLSLEEFISKAPNKTISNQITRSAEILKDEMCKSDSCIVCAISGGSDSDVMLDFLWHLDPDKKIKWVFYNTGIEMQATLNHLDWLEREYGIIIVRHKPYKPVAAGCGQYGLPFMSKRISDYISRLQKNGFMWESGTYEELVRKYPNCQSALRWWCSTQNTKEGKSHFNISVNTGLKEFMMENPIDFAVSPKCCDGAKKRTANLYMEEVGATLTCIGLRKAEGGSRSYVHTSCFEPNNSHGSQHYPLFFFTHEDKALYKKTYGLTYSDAYEVYGCKRTGCSGCPFGSGFENELGMLKEYEPKLYVAANGIFGKSYDYTRKYREFRDNFKKNKRGSNKNN